MQSSFIVFECPFNVFERRFNVFKCRFYVFERRNDKDAETNSCGLTILVHQPVGTPFRSFWFGYASKQSSFWFGNAMEMIIFGLEMHLKNGFFGLEMLDFAYFCLDF